MQRRTLLAAAAALGSTRAFALYDPKPNPLLADAPGAWTGTLTYRDWRNPDQMVTLPCKLSVALSAPDELALYYVFDDGPGKVVYSYERMSFDFTAKALTWVSGISKPETTRCVITAAGAGADGALVLFERVVEGRTDQYTLSVSRGALTLGKVEVVGTAAPSFRNRYEFRRGEA